MGSQQQSDIDINPMLLILSPLLPDDDDAPPQQDTNHQTPPLPVTNNYSLTSLNSTLRIRQLPSQGLSFQLWPAATTLLSLLNDYRLHPLASPLSPILSLFPNPLRILELGSGTGLVGISAAALLSANVTVTDLPHVLPNLKFNVELNVDVLDVGGGKVKVEKLRWGENEDMEAIGREYDLVLGSDVVYYDHLYEPLIATLGFLMKEKKGMVFLMGHLKRWKKESAFFKKAKKLFEVEVVHRDVPPADGGRVGVVVYSFARNGNERSPRQ